LGAVALAGKGVGVGVALTRAAPTFAVVPGPLVVPPPEVGLVPPPEAGLVGLSLIAALIAAEFRAMQLTSGSAHATICPFDWLMSLCRPIDVASPDREFRPAWAGSGAVAARLWSVTGLQLPFGRLRSMSVIVVEVIGRPPFALAIWSEAILVDAELLMATALPPIAEFAAPLEPETVALLPTAFAAVVVAAFWPVVLPAFWAAPAPTLPLCATARPRLSMFDLKCTSTVMGA
jgi:hypothetical protein